jgi:hypothetical protein
MHLSDVTNMPLIFLIKLVLNLPIYLTIQKPDRQLSAASFPNTLKPNVFDGTHYNRWRNRFMLWLTAMHCYFVVEPREVGPHTPEEDPVFHDIDTMFNGGNNQRAWGHHS